MDDDIDIDLCEKCYVNGGRDDHWHADGWLQIDPDGTHTQVCARVPSTHSSEPPQPDRLVRAVTASIEGRPCAACSKIFGLGEEIIQLRCRCAYHNGCLQPDDECCSVCTSAKNPRETLIESVYVKAADGRTLTFGVKPTDTISRLKELIAEEDQVEIKMLQLTWAGQDIRDAEPLLHFIGSPAPFELKIQQH